MDFINLALHTATKDLKENDIKVFEQLPDQKLTGQLRLIPSFQMKDNRKANMDDG